MAFTGLHVACSRIGFANPGAGYPAQSHSLQNKPAWSETLATAGITTNSAADVGETAPVLEITASADAWVSVGPTPDATAGPRVLVRAAETRRIIVVKGDRVGWITA